MERERKNQQARNVQEKEKREEEEKNKENYNGSAEISLTHSSFFTNGVRKPFSQIMVSYLNVVPLIKLITMY